MVQDKKHCSNWNLFEYDEDSFKPNSARLVLTFDKFNFSKIKIDCEPQSNKEHEHYNV